MCDSVQIYELLIFDDFHLFLNNHTFFFLVIFQKTTTISKVKLKNGMQKWNLQWHNTLYDLDISNMHCNCAEKNFKYFR